VHKQLEYLVQLQQVDLKILAIRRLIEGFPGKITQAESPLQESQDILNRIKQKFTSLEKKKREKEQALGIIDEKITKLKARSGEIKTNKEYQALLKEIETIERDRSSIEDDILAVMEDIDALGKEVKTSEEHLRMNSERVAAVKKTIENDKFEMEKELMAVTETRAGVIAGIDSEVYDQYIMLLEIHRGHAVIEVKDEICQGCNMNIPPQLFVEIKKNEEIYHCPHCRRILYFKEGPS
jgi:uncharacterized protein